MADIFGRKLDQDPSHPAAPKFHKFTMRARPSENAVKMATEYDIELDGLPLRFLQKIELTIDAESNIPLLRLTLIPGEIEIDSLQTQINAGFELPQVVPAPAFSLNGGTFFTDKKIRHMAVPISDEQFREYLAAVGLNPGLTIKK